MDKVYDKVMHFLREPKPPQEYAREFAQVRALSNSRRLIAVTWLMAIALLMFTVVDFMTIGGKENGTILWCIFGLRTLAVVGCGVFVSLFGKIETIDDLRPRHKWLWMAHVIFFLTYTTVIVGVMFPVKETVDPIYVFLLGPAAFLSMTRLQVIILQLVGLSSLTLSLWIFVPGSIPVKFHLINVLILSWVSLVVARITYGSSLRDFLNKRIIEQKNRELEVARARAEAGSRAKSDFLTAISHEIRTPMNSILGMLEVALHTPLSNEQRDYVETARESAVHLLDVIGDILDFSRIEAGKLRLIETHFDLPAVIQSALKTIRLQARQKGLDLDFEIMGNPPRFLKGDPGRLRQVLINLLNNAVKFTDEGFIRITAARWIEGSDDPDRPIGLRFTVKDSGAGICREKAATIFEAFTQVDGSTSRSYGGSGLGLAICKDLVEMMGGTISLFTKEGRGSEFVFTVRFAQGDGERATEPEMMAASWDVVQPVKPSRILLVEDNPLNVKVEKLHLDRLGMDTTVAESGTEALMLLAEQDFDLVLMDLEMPGMDGHETTRRIRSGQGVGSPVRQPNIPILAVTAHSLGEVRSRCELGGMNGFVPKPVGVGELGAALRQILGGEWSASLNQAKPPMEGASVLDLVHAANHLGVSQAEVRHLVPNAMEEIVHKTGLAEQGIQTGSLRETALQAHTLKSVAASIGAEATRRAAVKLENASRRDDVTLSARRLSELRVEVSRLEGAVAAL